jgi:hypothetical protein
MRKYCFIICILLISHIVYANENYTFRKTTWNMTIDQVINSEQLNIISNENNKLFYETSILNKDCYLFYNFNNNKLISAGYLFDIIHTNPNDYIDNYLEIQQSLIIKYKEPINNETIWKNNLYKSQQQFWGLAISMGHLIYQSIWETETTKIILKLYGDNYQNYLGIIYADKNYIPEAPATDDL